jgi:hypothetical protein
MLLFATPLPTPLFFSDGTILFIYFFFIFFVGDGDTGG